MWSPSPVIEARSRGRRSERARTKGSHTLMHIEFSPVEDLAEAVRIHQLRQPPAAPLCLTYNGRTRSCRIGHDDLARDH